MKATIKNQIRLAIVVACAVLFIGPSVVVAEETLLLASLTRVTPLDTFDNYDRFPDYHREARKEADEKEIKVEIDVIKDIQKEANADTVDTVITSAAWVGGKALDSYVILNGDYGKLLTGLFSE
ncbi:MAG: hypothetical protein JRI91_08140 [Deltaproteobacteria bacterium]|nr:hypothetical protein [Deltaproteobacteria bacterium]